MAKYDENAEVTGRYIHAFINSTGEISSIFEKKTREMFQEVIGDVDPEGWYKTGEVAEVFQRILDDVGAQTMKVGGEASGKEVPIPDDATLEEAYGAILGAHKEVFKGSDMEYPGGKYLYELDGRSARLGADEAFLLPKPFAKGVHTAMIEEYGPEDAIPEFEEVEPKDREQFAWEVTW
ncbi:hypothetical protein [Halorussus caseinilyticus]|uniref:Uncharacterized protein n=1 Tax=Halorussus caseinilyticus TaxID=3034025 RepID=A0ABD5WRF6_9EURY|nr:hypothetical protein [Halorussus sp. DT72]